MTAALEETPTDLEHLVQLARNGEEVVLTKAGQPVAKITAMPDDDWPRRRDEWLKELDELRAASDTGKRGGPTTEEILDELRADRC